MARSQLRDAKVHETATAVAERGKDLGAKGWSFIKGVYGTVATQVETVAKDSGYKLDLGEHQPHWNLYRLQGPRIVQALPRGNVVLL